MKYIPGSSKFERSLARVEKAPRNVYELFIKCDDNDADYRTDTLHMGIHDMTEKDILMIAYLNMHSRYDIPENWKDARNERGTDLNFPFGGTFIERNDRFGEDWLYEYATYNEFLLRGTGYRGRCHSIESIDVTYYDENGVKYGCKDVNIGELFDSEQEFINYVTSL